MTHFKTFLLIATSLLFVACGGASETAPTSSRVTTTKAYENVQKTSQNQILVAINKARAVARDCHDGLGLVAAAPALTWNNELYASALEHSTDLATSNTFSHYGSGTASDVTGSNNGNSSYFIDRIEANGYNNYTIIGENIAGGQESIEAAITAWLASPAHCTNIMNPEFTEIGVAVATNANSDYGIYWTQSFGSKK